MLDEYNKLVRLFYSTRDTKIIIKILQLFNINLGKEKKQIEIVLEKDKFAILDNKTNTKCYVNIFDDHYSIVWNKNGYKYEEVYDYNHKSPIEFVYKIDNDKNETIICKRAKDKNYINNSILKFVNNKYQEALVYEKIYSTSLDADESIEIQTNTYDFNTFRSTNILYENNSYLIEDEISNKNNGYIINSLLANKVPFKWLNMDMGKIPNLALADGLPTLYFNIVKVDLDECKDILSIFIKKENEIIEGKIYQNQKHLETFHLISDTWDEMTITDLDEIANALKDINFIKNEIIMIVYEQIRNLFIKTTTEESIIEHFCAKNQKNSFQKMIEDFNKNKSIYEEEINKDYCNKTQNLTKVLKEGI